MVDLASIHALPEGAQEFFLIFTRCEYALKACGLFKVENNQLKADWEEFAEDLGGAAFLDFVRASGRANTLLRQPPRKQVAVREGERELLRWRDVRAVATVDDLFRAVKGTRNNLVHGGKAGHPDEEPAHRERGAVLIAEARWVLLEALERHDEVRFSFETYRA